jgi:hypothetical protein
MRPLGKAAEKNGEEEVEPVEMSEFFSVCFILIEIALKV